MSRSSGLTVSCYQLWRILGIASIRKDNFLAQEVINSKLANPLQTRGKMTEMNNDTWLSINNWDLIYYVQTK